MKQIKKLRASLKLTQKEFAELIRANRVTVARWEIGESKPRGLYRDALADIVAKMKEGTLLVDVKYRRGTDKKEVKRKHK